MILTTLSSHLGRLILACDICVAITIRVWKIITAYMGAPLSATPIKKNIPLKTLSTGWCLTSTLLSAWCTIWNRHSNGTLCSVICTSQPPKKIKYQETDDDCPENIASTPPHNTKLMFETPIRYPNNDKCETRMYQQVNNSKRKMTTSKSKINNERRC